MSKKRNNKKRQARERQGENRAQQALIRRVRKNRQQGLAVTAAVDGVRMSEVMDEFLDPYRDPAGTIDEYRKLLILGIMAWNLALLPESKRSRMFGELSAGFPADARVVGERIITELIVRKERDFPQHRRMILDFEVIDAGSHWDLSLVSTPGPV